MTENSWIKWAREIQALAQTGLTYTENHFQTGRYQRLTEIAAEMMAGPSGIPASAILQILETQIGYATPKHGSNGPAKSRRWRRRA